MSLNFVNQSSARFMVSYVMVIILLLSVVSSACEAAPPRSKPLKATWLWDTSLISTLENRDSVLQFAKEQSVNRIYVQVNPDEDKSSYRAFIHAAAAAGIQIHALDGAAHWVQPDHHQLIVDMVKWVKDYNASVLETERFTGIQVDIEPYVLPEWQSEQNAMVTNWIGALALFSSEVKQDTSLTASAALPFWLHQIAVPGISGMMLNEKLLSLFDEVTLMSYRDQAQAIVDITAADIALGDRLGKKIFIGVETNPSSEGNFVTFYEEGSAAMNLQLNIIDDLLKSHASYAGIAIHDYTGWKNLKP
jgi:hypothetical protein